MSQRVRRPKGNEGMTEKLPAGGAVRIHTLSSLSQLGRVCGTPAPTIATVASKIIDHRSPHSNNKKVQNIARISKCDTDTVSKCCYKNGNDTLA